MDQLALMIGKGFNEAKEERKGIKAESDALKMGQIRLEENQEEIKLKLSRIAYTFEVRELERRVGIIEAKLGLQEI